MDRAQTGPYGALFTRPHHNKSSVLVARPQSREYRSLTGSKDDRLSGVHLLGLFGDEFRSLTAVPCKAYGICGPV